MYGRGKARLGGSSGLPLVAIGGHWWPLVAARATANEAIREGQWVPMRGILVNMDVMGFGWAFP